MAICKICNKKVKSLASHVKSCHDISLTWYRDKYPTSPKSKLSVAKPPKKKRKKKPKHKTGYLNTVKAGRVLYKSSWEKAVVGCLESRNDVVSFSLEGHHTYFTDKYGKRKKTILDFVAKLSNGKKMMVDVKPFSLLHYGNNQEKMVAYKAFCEVRGIEYFLLTENNMEILETKIDKMMADTDGLDEFAGDK